MNQTALELYLYMCSSEPVIKWLEEEGVKTQEEAIAKLTPMARALTRDVVISISAGRGGTLAGAANCMKKILTHFEAKKDE